MAPCSNKVKEEEKRERKCCERGEREGGGGGGQGGGGEAGRVRGAQTPCGDTMGAMTPCVVSKWKMGRKDGSQSTMAKYHHSLGVKTAEME